jgi:hypothetical protein
MQRNAASGLFMEPSTLNRYFRINFHARLAGTTKHENRIQGAEGSRIHPLDSVELLKRFPSGNRVKGVELPTLESLNP